MGLNGNVGNKNSGRKTDAEIIAKAINTGLANKIGNEELKRIEKEKDRRRDDLREIVMPIVLKGMIERKDLTSGGKPIPLLQGITNNKDVHTDNSASETPEAEKED